MSYKLETRVHHVCVCRYRPSAAQFPIVVSQDCGHEPTAQAIASYGSKVTHIKVRGRGLWRECMCVGRCGCECVCVGVYVCVCG